MIIIKDLIIKEIRSFVNSSPLNQSPEDNYRYFDDPLIGFASINDPIFLKFKEKIGEVYLTPIELLKLELGLEQVENGTMISWILPINEKILASNRAETSLPSKELSHMRLYGEKFTIALTEHIVQFLTKAGFKTFAPSINTRYKHDYSQKGNYSSSWSERHAAYAAGLGTFSLNNALITERGIAHRCGSLITTLSVEPTQLPYTGIYDYCLHYNSQKCDACIKRCPADAISIYGHNKELCYDYIHSKVMPTLNEEYGVTKPSCSLCQTRVPCEKCIPGKMIINQ